MSLIVDERGSNAHNETAVETQYVTPDGTPNVALLHDRTPEWLRSSTATVWLTLALAVMFLYSSILPVWHTDLWGHLNYGRWIVAHKAVPTVEPTLPLAKGVPFVDLPWLSQVLGYGMISQFDVAGIQFLNGLGIVTVAALLSFAVFRRTGSLAAALVTMFAFYWGSYQQILVVRPQLAGTVCFALVFMMATAPRWKRWYTLAIPLTFVFWANMHGSFIVGLGLLGAMTAGRAADVYLKTRKLKYVFAESEFRGLLLAAELSAVAVLLNPYGIGAYAEVFAVSGNKNLESLLEWEPLTLRMKQGRAAFSIALALVCLYRFSPRRVTVQEVLLLGGLGAGMLWHSRMIVWWAPVAAYYLGLHLAAVVRHVRHRAPAPRTTGGLWTVVCLGIVWIAFAYSPMGIRVVQGKPQDPKVIETRFRRSVSPMTPIHITDYLNRHAPTGLVFNTYEWGDYLQWAGPKDMQLFVNSHAHLIPEEVWRDYFGISNMATGWENKLDRYGVQAVVVDQLDRGDFIKAMEKLPNWEKKYSDNKGAIFYRKPL
ncbi:hypothetical protein [Planctomicrobium piriforme]|uniref:Dolichyl-phosphate-mannose-protein mannosyltransferase n=1 Tax=Planctomicrobium piriforme TaxID=1576369 RepID=A0A1I3BC58_9PLAN|nr:hypothetical protein [Planctomicrobium piriforme]SFH59301.1 hypothetical protein SAMN05421753_101341 [Planctomicrobium piriforme]